MKQMKQMKQVKQNKQMTDSEQLEKFKRVKAIIDGTAKPFIPKSQSNKTSSKKSFGRSKSRKNQDEEYQDKYSKYLDDDEDDNGEEELDSYKLPKKFDDEEIEEDEAFDDDDEETSGLKKNDKTDFEDEYDNDDFIDLSELLDDDTSSVSSSKSNVKQVSTKQTQIKSQRQQQQQQQQQVPSEEEEEEESSGDDDDNDNEQSDLDESELEFSENEFDDEEPSEEDDNNLEEEGVNTNLLSIVKNLEKNKPSKSTKKLPDMTESVGDESLFGMFPNADENGTIDINDLMSFMPDEFEQFKEQLGEIADKNAIAAPLSKFEKDKIQRRITTEQAHKILTQWVPFVREQREKNLVFDPKVVVANTVQSVASSFQKSDLNDEINKALQESGAIQSSDSKKQTTIDPIEAKRQLRETIKLRNIMYYQELKDKRRKKIKSKKYRKILKKEKEKEAKKLEDRLKELDPDFAKKLAEKAEEKRILERMTFKHKNHSKFMNQLIKGGLNKEQRQDLNEQRQISDQIMQRANRFNNSDDDDDSSGDDSSGEYESEDEQPNKVDSKIDLSEVDQQAMSDRERIQLKLQKLGKPTNIPEKGINAMKFMQKALERDLDSSIKKMNGIDDYEQAELDEQEKQVEQSNRIAIHKQVATNKQSSNKIMSSGQLVERAGFGNGHKVKSGISLDILNNKDNQNNNNNNNNNKQNKKQQQQQEEQEQENNNEEPIKEELDEENPWLEVTKSKKKSKKEKKKQSNEFLISLNNLNNNNNSSNNNNNNSSNNNVSKEKVKNNDLPISVDNSDSNNNNNNNNNNNKNNNKRKHQDKEDDDNKKLKKSVGMSLITSNKQKDLLLEAFAQDNIEDEFMEEKKQMLEDEVPEEKSNYLPGWGSWVGDGAKQRDNSKRDAALKRKRDEKLREAAKRRIDAQNSRVIIDEKAPLEGASKYILNKLPQHYSNKEQYESTLSIAHGKDWNSTTAFRKLIEPKVSVLPGTFINPVSTKDKQEFIMKKKEEKNQKSKK